MDYGDIQIASSSPERLLLCDGSAVEARPIKGTRRRDPDSSRDAALIAELTSSRKDRAENVMIVDLLRNDLSRVSKPGSVKVPVLCGLESYANVHHLVSVITSELRDGLGIGDLIGATFPGGSITGAPKIRTMALITELEDRPRGVYCGAVGVQFWPYLAHGSSPPWWRGSSTGQATRRSRRTMGRRRWSWHAPAGRTRSCSIWRCHR